MNDVASQDYPSGAVVLQHSSDNCSPLADYTTNIGIPDGAKPENWSNGLNANVWFKFQATTNQVAVDLNVDGDEGSLLYPKLALFNPDMTEIVSVSDDGIRTDVGLSNNTLTIGEWYYISVDNGANQGHRGSFTLCLDNETTYDFPSGAIELTDLNAYCSQLGEFTSQIGTADGSRPSQWNNGPNANVWFTFIAQGSTVSIDVKIDGSEGDLLYPKVALFKDNFDEVSSKKDQGIRTDINLSESNLTIGDRYFISIDNGVNQVNS